VEGDDALVSSSGAEELNGQIHGRQWRHAVSEADEDGAGGEDGARDKDGADIDIDPDELLSDDMHAEVLQFKEECIHLGGRCEDQVPQAEDEKQKLSSEGFSISVKKGGEQGTGPSCEWKMVDDWEPDTPFQECINLGIASFDLVSISNRDFPRLISAITWLPLAWPKVCPP